MSFYLYQAGLVSYDKACRMQKEIRHRIINGQARDILIILEHLPTITVGKSGKVENILVSGAELARRKISLFFTDRGGDVTYHGPGQLIAYPVVNLDDREIHLKEYVRCLEETILLTLADYSIEGHRDINHAGIWVNNSEIAAIGLNISKWVTIHGIALNVNLDLQPFSLINPCGFTDRSATSMSEVLSRNITVKEVTENFKKHFSNIFQTELEPREISLGTTVNI